MQIVNSLTKTECGTYKRIYDKIQAGARII